MHNIFVKNLAFTATRADIKKLFETYGIVANAMIKEKRQGKSMGFGFIEMPNEGEKNKAIAELNGKDFMGRPLTVSHYVARAKGVFNSKKSKFGDKKFDDTRESRPRGERRPPRDDERPSRDNDRPSKPFVKTDFKAKATGYPRHIARPQRSDDRESKPWSGHAKFVSKAPFKKFDGTNKPGSRDEAGAKSFIKPSAKPFVKTGGSIKNFFNTGKPAKSFEKSRPARPSTGRRPA